MGRSESVERDGAEFYSQQGLDEDYGAGEVHGGIHPGEGGIFNSPIQVFSPTRQHVGYPFLFAPANPNMYGINPESDKFRKLMLKKQKRESRKPKNVLSEFKSEDISGHKFEDLDSVLQSLGEVKEEKKG